jgi:hypothetical protein
MVFLCTALQSIVSTSGLVSSPRKRLSELPGIADRATSLPRLPIVSLLSVRMRFIVLHEVQQQMSISCLAKFAPQRRIQPPSVHFETLPSYLASLGSALLTNLFDQLSLVLMSGFVFSVCRLVSRRCHIFPNLNKASACLRYILQGSDSSACHLRQRPPQLLRFAFRMFCLQTRYAPTHRSNHHDSMSHEFQTSPRMRRLVANTPPNLVSYPADHLFASGCSPPHITVTQLPSATWLWYTTVRTYTELTKRLPGRTQSHLYVG